MYTICGQFMDINEQFFKVFRHKRVNFRFKELK